MAFVGTRTWLVTFNIRDNNNKTSRTALHVDNTVIFSDVTTIADTLATRIQAVTDGALVEYDITRTFRNDAVPANLPATSEVERKLRIPLSTADFDNITYLEVPSASFALEIAGTDVVDQANAALVALKNALLNVGGVLGSTAVKTYYGEDITKAGDAFIMHRNRKANK